MVLITRSSIVYLQRDGTHYPIANCLFTKRWYSLPDRQLFTYKEMVLITRSSIVYLQRDDTHYPIANCLFTKRWYSLPDRQLFIYKEMVLITRSPIVYLQRDGTHYPIANCLLTKRWYSLPDRQLFIYKEMVLITRSTVPVHHSFHSLFQVIKVHISHSPYFFLYVSYNYLFMFNITSFTNILTNTTFTCNE